MSDYDLIAISQKPDFYFSSNASGDQSGKNIYTLTNNSSNVGQPIINGNPSSWKISDTLTLDLDLNPIFFKEDSNMEFVIQMLQPTVTTCIFGDSNSYNGLFVTNSSIQIRFVDSNLVQKSASIEFEKWPEKMHVIVSFDSQYCTLRANSLVAQVAYRETDPDSLSNLSFKSNVDNIYYIDGLGIYTDTFSSKSEYVNSKPFDYLDFINNTYDGLGTLFDSYRGLDPTYLSNLNFTPDPLLEEWHLYTLVYPLTSEEDFASVAIESNYNDMVMQYSTNDVAWTQFIGKVSFTPSTNFFVLQIRVKTQDIMRPFSIKVFVMFDNKISTRTPAELTPSGGPFYPSSHTVSMVNFPEGVELYDIYYAGEWIDDIPETIEIMFMPKETSKIIVFESADGSVSCGTSGSITGYTAYLNGQLVSNLNNVRINQWNHLVLLKSSPTATDFNLNSNVSGGSTGIIEYALLAAYPTQLDSTEISEIYAILSSYHKLSLIENPTDIVEGNLDSGSPYKLYTYAWATIGGGGV